MPRRQIGREARKRRGLTAVGRFNSGLGDLAEEHDRYLVDAFGSTMEPPTGEVDARDECRDGLRDRQPPGRRRS